MTSDDNILDENATKNSIPEEVDEHSSSVHDDLMDDEDIEVDDEDNDNDDTTVNDSNNVPEIISASEWDEKRFLQIAATKYSKSRVIGVDTNSLDTSIP